MSRAARTYHHGDLRHALTEEAFRLARAGGSSAISLREVTRGVGVSPNAAYRHFADRDALVRAAAGQAQLALARAIQTHIDAAPTMQDAGAAAIDRLRSIGLGYIDFARREQGWFELAYSTQDPQPNDSIVTLDDRVVAPFQLLLDALDAMVDAQVLSPKRRPQAEWACWSAVHGFAEIAVHGPLQSQPPEVIDALGASVVETTIAGVRGTGD